MCARLFAATARRLQVGTSLSAEPAQEQAEQAQKQAEQSKERNTVLVTQCGEAFVTLCQTGPYFDSSII